MVRTLTTLGCALLGITTVLAAGEIQCSLDKKCPLAAPCCGQYGQCGVGAFCLGGCDQRMSYSMDACVPMPVCKSGKFPMNSLDRIKSTSEYLGDPKTADWTYQGEPILHDGKVLLTMPPRTVGTVLASTFTMWYGSVKATLKTSRGAGVVTAFIIYGGVKDEIDYEFVGNQLEIAQTNYYFQGVTDYTNSGNISLSNVYDNFHTYEINWTPDEIKWLVDGQVGRTKKRSETYNATSRQYQYPQTPSLIQFSIWPAGAPTNPKGTVDWAGGPIDYNSEDIRTFGYDFATLGEIEVKCYDAQSPPGTNKGVSYWYNDPRVTNDTVVDGDKPTVLKSLLGTGLNMDVGDPNNSSSTPGTGPPSVPGGSVLGPGQNGANQGSNPGTAPGGGGGGSGTTPPQCQGTGFAQTCNSPNKPNGGQRVGETHLAGASVFAGLVAVAGVLML